MSIPSRLPFVVALAACVSFACGESVEQGDDVLDVAAGLDEGEYGKADTAAGNIELKVTIQASQRTKAQTSFKLTDTKATLRDVWFYDTEALDLSGAGLVLRSRKVKGASDDSTVKLRPMDPADVDDAWFSLSGFKCEEDRVGTRGVKSCSLTAKQDKGEIDDVGDGDRTPDKLFSSDQEAFASEYFGDVDWSEVVPLGPTPTFVWKVSVKNFAWPLTFERWEIPDGTKLLEVSIKVRASEVAKATTAFKALLKARGLDASSDQETKTKVALEYWSGR